MLKEDRDTLKSLKSRKVSRGKDRVKDYAISAGKGALLGASADLLSPYSGKKSLLFPLIGAGALTGVGYEAYKGMKKKAALDNSYIKSRKRSKGVLRKKQLTYGQVGPFLSMFNTGPTVKKAALDNFYMIKEARVGVDAGPVNWTPSMGVLGSFVHPAPNKRDFNSYEKWKEMERESGKSLRARRYTDRALSGATIGSLGGLAIALGSGYGAWAPLAALPAMGVGGLAGLGYAMYEEEPKGSINKHARDEAYYAYLSVKKG